MPRVRKDFGYPPLVTPTSQIVGYSGRSERGFRRAYKMFPKESKALLRGEYGRLPGQVNEEVREGYWRCQGYHQRPADDIPPELEKYRAEIGDYIQQDEDILSYALFPQVAKKFFQYRDAAQKGLDSTMFNKSDMTHPV